MTGGLFSSVLYYVNTSTILVGLVAGLLTYYIHRRLKYRLPPGPWGLPLVGNFNIYTSKGIHREVWELTKKYGPVISISVGTSKWVFLNSYDAVIEALVKKQADFASRPKMNSMDFFTLGSQDIAFAPYSAKWKYQKKVAGKAIRYYLQGTHLEQMVADVCNKVFQKMSEETGEFVVKEYIHKMIIHMLYDMCFGKKCDLDDPDVNFVMNGILGLNEKTSELLLEDMIPYMKEVYTTKRWRETLKLMKNFQDFLFAKFKEHKETFDPNSIRDYTDSLLMSREEAEREGNREEGVNMLSDEQILVTLTDILFAGMDTTRMTLDWFVCFMVAYPECQAKCREEIDRVVGKSRPPCTKDRERLPFTEACIMETMRKGSVVSTGLPHYTICDTSVGGYDVPKDTMVIINHWALHHDPGFWKNPDQFDPYRYLDNEGRLDKKPEYWLPFSAGRRVCLGEPVARSELLLIVANVLQNFTFKSPPAVNKFVPEVAYAAPGIEVPADYKVIIERRQVDY